MNCCSFQWTKKVAASVAFILWEQASETRQNTNWIWHLPATLTVEIFVSITVNWIEVHLLSSRNGNIAFRVISFCVNWNAFHILKFRPISHCRQPKNDLTMTQHRRPTESSREKPVAKASATKCKIDDEWMRIDSVIIMSISKSFIYSPTCRQNRIDSETEDDANEKRDECSRFCFLRWLLLNGIPRYVFVGASLACVCVVLLTVSLIAMTPAAFFIQMRQRVWTDTRRNMFQFRWFFMFLDVETTDRRKNAEKREREKTDSMLRQTHHSFIKKTHMANESAWKRSDGKSNGNASRKQNASEKYNLNFMSSDGRIKSIEKYERKNEKNVEIFAFDWISENAKYTHTHTRRQRSTAASIHQP